MGLIDRWLRQYQDDWCRNCKCAMEKHRKQLYALPNVSVGHYVERKEPDYYKKNLHPVNRKADIQYRCPQCGKRLTVLDPFLPVRDEEKHEGNIVFQAGELDDFLWR